MVQEEGGRRVVASENLRLEENIKNLRLRWTKYIGQIVPNCQNKIKWSNIFNISKIAKIIKTTKFVKIVQKIS